MRLNATTSATGYHCNLCLFSSYGGGMKMDKDWRYLDEHKPSIARDRDIFQVKWGEEVVYAALIYDRNGRDCYFENMFGDGISGHVKYRKIANEEELI